MKRFLPATVVLATALAASGAERRIVRPFESDGAAQAAGAVDTAVLNTLRTRGIEPAPLCSDEVFVRRVFLDVIGTLPEPAEVRSFLQDARPTKRADLIDTLLARDAFADYWAMKWCDVLRVKSEFPINLWPNAVQAYHRWIRDAIRENRAYDRFVRELLTSSGSNFRVPPVNFYRAIQGREPSAIADAVALTFMGTRLARWTPEQREQMAVFFSRITYKETREWKEEIVLLNPAPVGAIAGILPDGTTAQIPAGQDPRSVFADWLLAEGNPWFARCIVNRVWAWLLGRGVVHEPDDIRADNPPSNPELLAALERELVGAHYDLRHLYRVILNSRTYQQSSIPRGTDPEAEALFAHYPVRRLDAEVIVDALNQLFGATEKYSSAIPEPFSIIPEDQRTIALADGSVTSSFLEMFGRPARDSGLMSERNLQATDAQALHLLNSSHIRRKIEGSRRIDGLMALARRDRRRLIRGMYVSILSREPTLEELAAVEAYFGAGGIGERQAAQDLAWALINSKEFLYRH